jgi:hypothetical protein
MSVMPRLQPTPSADAAAIWFGRLLMEFLILERYSTVRRSKANILVRLKEFLSLQVKTLSKLFKDSNYGQAWESDKQIQIKKKFAEENPDEPIV